LASRSDAPALAADDVTGAGMHAAEHRRPLLRGGPAYLPGVLAVTVGLTILLVFGAITPGFLTVANGKAILLSASIVGVLAIGETFVMISGSLFSLSIAQIAAATAMIYLPALRYGIGAAILIALALAVALNAVQGSMIGWWRANPIIVTIAIGSLTEGGAMVISGNRNIYPPEGNTKFMFILKNVGGISVSTYLFLFVGLVAAIVMSRTRFGMQLYMMGDNRRAARAAGLPVANLTIGAFVAAGLCAGVAGLMLAAISGQAQSSLAGNSTYDAIAAALVGGSAVTGGRGSIGRTVLGAIVIAAVTDLALQRGYNEGAQLVVKGVLVFVAVLLVRFAGRSGTRTA